MKCASMLLVLGLSVYQVMAVHETHHIVVQAPGYDVHQDIVINVEENYLYNIVGNVENCERCLASVNYHDFDTGMAVFKNIPAETCYLLKSPVDVLNMTLYRTRNSAITKYFAGLVHPRILPSTEVESLAGRRIAEFCQDYSVKKMTYRQPRTDDLTKPYRRAMQAIAMCGDCQFQMTEQRLPDEIAFVDEIPHRVTDLPDFDQVWG